MTIIAGVLLLTGFLSLTSLWWFRRWWSRCAIAVPAIVLMAPGGYLFWYEHRFVPSPIEETWFEGVKYSRIVRREPRPLIAHIVTIDLDAAGIDFLVTPPVDESKLPLRGQTTSGFLDAHGAQVAINGDFFYPWHAEGPFRYYPHVGDPVSVQGLAMAEGRVYAKAKPGHATLFLTRDNRIVIGDTCADAWQAVSGADVIVKEGKFALEANPSATSEFEPRTAVALSKDERTLFLVVIDGRQPNYSEGASLEELAEIIRERGGWTALYLDGGGSSTLVREGDRGRAIVVNSPIHGRHPPGRERPVANHLGVFAKRR